MHVEGLNWSVIKVLTLQYGSAASSASSTSLSGSILINDCHINSLHPLAVEDALRATNSPRSKLDFYKTHLYLQILVQHTQPSDEAVLSAAADEMAVTHLRDEFSSGSGNERRMMKLPEGVEGVFEPSIGGSRLQGGKSVSHTGPASTKDSVEPESVN